MEKRLSPAERALQTMIAAGYSRTAPRRAVVEVIARAEGCQGPVEILQRGRQLHPTLGLVTVYRTLELLTELGLVRKIHQQNGCHSYALAEKAHGHHIICERCQQVIEFEGCDLDVLFRNVTRQTGFEVKDHWLELFGLCPACRAKG